MKKGLVLAVFQQSNYAPINTFAKEVIESGKLGDIKQVISHPQALGQCAAQIEMHGFATVEAVNTAVAAKQVAEGGEFHIAAIGSEEAAEKFGHALAIVTGVSSWDDMLSAEVKSVSAAAEKLGVVPGISGKEALKILH